VPPLASVRRRQAGHRSPSDGRSEATRRRVPETRRAIGDD
jgi:hypothetical protein